MPQTLLSSALLGIVEQSATAVVTLIENLEREEFLRSRLTRREVQRQLITLGESLAQLPDTTRHAMPELDWPAWAKVVTALQGQPGEAQDEALWFACEALTPATVLWLRVYKQSQPDWFKMTV